MNELILLLPVILALLTPGLAGSRGVEVLDEKEVGIYQAKIRWLL